MIRESEDLPESYCKRVDKLFARYAIPVDSSMMSHTARDRSSFVETGISRINLIGLGFFMPGFLNFEGELQEGE